MVRVSSPANDLEQQLPRWQSHLFCCNKHYYVCLVMGTYIVIILLGHQADDYF